MVYSRSQAWIVGLVVMTAAYHASARPIGPIELHIDPVTGEGYLINTGDTDFLIDAYDIKSTEPGYGMVPDQWKGICWQAQFDFTQPGVPAPGPFDEWKYDCSFTEAMSWGYVRDGQWTYLKGEGEASPEPWILGELTLGRGVTLAPGETLPMGNPFVGGNAQRLSLAYANTSGIPWNGQVVYTWDGNVVPEPAALSLLGLGALAMLRRRR